MTLCVLSGARSEDVVSEPFSHLIRTDVFPGEEYEKLAAEFPSMELILGGRSDLGSNYAARMPASKALSHPDITPRWKEFIRHHTSSEHWRDIVKVFGTDLRRIFPSLEERIGKEMENWSACPRDVPGEADIRLDCQFVINTPVREAVSVRPAHIDKRTTIYSGLFYMRDPKDSSTGGDLELFGWKRTPRFLKTRACIPSDIELRYQVGYKANCYASFINSPASVHGVSKRGMSALPRRYINFIVEVPVPAFSYKKIGPLGHAWMRLQGIDYLPRDIGGDRY